MQYLSYCVVPANEKRESRLVSNIIYHNYRNYAKLFPPTFSQGPHNIFPISCVARTRRPIQQRSPAIISLRFNSDH